MPVVEFLQFTLSGVVFGMIYAVVALSLVLIWRGTRLLNYAQGGMAMFTTYVAIEVIYRTGSYWAGFVVALATGAVLGAVCQLTVIRPTLNKPPLNAVIVTIGLLTLLEGLAGIFYGGQYRSFPAAFSITGLKVGTTPLGVSRYDVFVVAAVLVTTLALAVAFRYTSAGLRMRAAAFNATIARLARHPGGAGAHRRMGAGGPARRARRRARLAVDVPVPEQHGHDLRVRLHRGGDRRPGQPGRRGDRRAAARDRAQLRGRLPALRRQPGADGGPRHPHRGADGPARRPVLRDSVRRV